jgi:cytochrome P450
VLGCGASIVVNARLFCSLTQVWSEPELLEEVRLVVNAAHDPALPLSFALHALASRAALVDELRAELQAVLGERQEVTRDDVRSLRLLEAVWYESLRLFPVSGIGTGECVCFSCVHPDR